MDVDAIGVTNTSSTSSVQQNTLAQDDFLKLFMSQLTYQDPLEPVDNAEFLAQMAQFSAVEQSQQMNTKLDSLVLMQSIDQAVSLIGKTVRYEGYDNSATGTVSSVNFSESGPLLTINTGEGDYVTDVRLSEIKVLSNIVEE